MVWAVTALCWIVCGILAYGFTFAYFQRQYPILSDANRIYDRMFAILFLIGGLFGLVIVVIRRGYQHGWKL